MTMYYKDSVIKNINNMKKNEGFIVLDRNLNICTGYSDNDFEGCVLVCNKDYENFYWIEYQFGKKYCTKSKKDLCKGMTKVQKEIIDNWDAIVAGTYVSSVVLAAEARKEKEAKKAIAEKKKADREAKRISDCKTFNVDFFNTMDCNYLDAIGEIGRRLQDGEYSDLVLNDRLTIEFRTKNKRKDMPFTTNVCDIRTFTDGSKYGDLWEDIDDNMEVYLLNSLVGASYNKNYYELEQVFKNLEWQEMYADSKKKKAGDDENVVKAADMLISSVKAYTERDCWYETKLSWEDKKFIIQTLLDA